MTHTSIIPTRRRSVRSPVGKTYGYKVIIEQDEGRYHAEIPALPGCYSWGHTYEEALKNIKEATELWLETLSEDGKQIPEEDPQTLRRATVTLGVVL